MRNFQNISPIATISETLILKMEEELSGPEPAQAASGRPEAIFALFPLRMRRGRSFNQCSML